MIKQLDISELPRAAEVIRESFATIAKDLGFNEQTFPTFTGFVTTVERLQTHANWGWWIYGLHENERLVGYASISKVKDTDRVYELHMPITVGFMEWEVK